MSEKKRRDITLGEMQDECKRRNRDCMAHTYCEYRWYCDPILNATEFDSITPLSNDLTDPPRFNEAQMAFWRGWYAMGAKFVRRWKVGHITFLNEYGDTIGTIERHLDLADVLEVGETLDLAELLGKDAT